MALALVAASGAARADKYEDEDGEFVPLPTWSLGVAFGGHGTRIGGHSEAGLGPSLELALGRDRWQYFAEGSLQSSSVTSPASYEPMASGRLVHAGGGVRWLARQFRPDSGGGIELFLLSRVGFQRFSLDDGTRFSRPELAFGFGIQGRMYRRPRLAFRLDMRVLFTPNDDGDRLASCRDGCMNDRSPSTGFSTGVGFAW